MYLTNCQIWPALWIGGSTSRRWFHLHPLTWVPVPTFATVPWEEEVEEDMCLTHNNDTGSSVFSPLGSSRQAPILSHVSESCPRCQAAQSVKTSSPASGSASPQASSLSHTCSLVFVSDVYLSSFILPCRIQATVQFVANAHWILHGQDQFVSQPQPYHRGRSGPRQPPSQHPRARG